MSELSVSPSVNRVKCDKTKETYAHILIPHKIAFTLPTFLHHKKAQSFQFCNAMMIMGAGVSLYAHISLTNECA